MFRSKLIRLPGETCTIKNRFNELTWRYWKLLVNSACSYSINGQKWRQWSCNNSYRKCSVLFWNYLCRIEAAVSEIFRTRGESSGYQLLKLGLEKMKNNALCRDLTVDVTASFNFAETKLSAIYLGTWEEGVRSASKML